MTTQTDTVTFRSILSDRLDILAAGGASFYSYSETVEPGDTVSDGGYRLKSLPTADGATFMVPPHSMQGDYVGGTVERSNREVLRELVESDDGNGVPPLPYVELCADFSTSAIGLLLDVPLVGEDQIDAANEIAERIIGLTEYPLLDEDHHTNLESELVADDWGEDGDAANDFARELTDVAGLGAGTELRYSVEIDNENRDALWSLHRAASELANVNGGTGYEIETGCNVHHYHDEVAKAVHPVALFALGLVRIDPAMALPEIVEAIDDGPDASTAAEEWRRVERLQRISRAVRSAADANAGQPWDRCRRILEICNAADFGDCLAPLGPDHRRNPPLRTVTIEGKPFDPYGGKF